MSGIPKPFAQFRLAVTNKYATSQGEPREDTEWFTVVVWNRLAESVHQHLTKGGRVYVEGTLKSKT